MTMATTCSHCDLPVGSLGMQREVAGELRHFCCYGCCLAWQVHHGEREEPEAAAFLIRLGVGAFLAMFIMLFSLLQYSGAFAATDAWIARLVDLVLWLLATPLLAILGQPFFAGAWTAARSGRLNADALVSIGTLAAYGFSAWQVVRGSGLVYFDTVAMVLMLFTLGRYLEAQGRVRAARSLAPMLAAERTPVRVLDSGHETVLPAAAVQSGDIVRVLPGERLAIDGTVTEGLSSCDESILTGQPDPRPKAAGDTVHAGSVNGRGQLLVRASVAGTATAWAHSGRLVREALARKSMLGDTIDRVAAAFIPLVLVLAAGTAWYWGSRAGVDAALLAALSVLVVACPCSLGLAAPLAMTLGIGQAAQRGILIRGGAVLEKLPRLRAVAFDKTGTLTRGELQALTLAVDGASARQVLRHARALAATSDHPTARALLARARRPARIVPAREVQADPGAGVAGEIDGTPCAMGSHAFMTALGWHIPAALAPSASPQTYTRVYIGWNGRVHGLASFADPPLAEAATVVAALRRRGLRCMLLSGDGAASVARFGATLGTDEARGALLPAAKVAALREWRRHYGMIAMVGDGLNDGPVLAAADVGIAVGGATDLARESADLILPRNGLAQLPWTLALAHAVRRSVRANLLWAFGYNAVALTLAAAGMLQPVLAAALMAGSSVLVVARTLRAQYGMADHAASAVQAPGPRPATFRTTEVVR